MSESTNPAETPASNESPAGGNESTVFNVPNQLSMLRLILSVVLFGFLAWECYVVAMVLFLIAALTDFVDGWYARKYEQVTQLGRILDPFADKTLICGTFIFLAAVPAMRADIWFGVQAWMVVVIVAREMLVTALRGFIEERGGDFSAKMAGKLKMVLQCVAAATAMFYLTYPIDPGTRAVAAPERSRWLLGVSLWGTVLLTLYSGLMYVLIAIQAVKK